MQPKMFPTSLLGEAIDFARGQWPRLLVFLTDGRVEIDNNSIYAARGINLVMPTPDLCRAELRGLGFPEETEDQEIAHAS
jgi:hypothetical protein